MRTPLVVVTGVDSAAMDGALVSLSWDLPRAVVVRHRIDPDSQVLTRTVSDASGILEQEQITLEHACVSCAIREDIVPTLERLARTDRWGTILAGLPTSAEASRLAQLLTRDSRLARHLLLTGVVAAMAAGSVAEDLLGDELLRECGRHTGPGDDRGLGEVACAQIESADVVVLGDDPGPEGRDLVRALARPDARVVLGFDQLEGTALLRQRHQLSLATAWHSPDRGTVAPSLGNSLAWRLELSSIHPFHPERLLDHVGRLGTGRHRSRGCFWLPTRPGSVLAWAGAGGQLGIGDHGNWGGRTPATRLLFTGLGTPPPTLVTTFEDLLITSGATDADSARWTVLEDGFEPWLGDIRDVA